MRQVRNVLRLKAAGVSGNEIARRVGVAPSTVRANSALKSFVYVSFCIRFSQIFTVAPVN